MPSGHRLTIRLGSDWYSFNEYIAKMQLEDAPLAGTSSSATWFLRPNSHLHVLGLRAQEVLKPLLLRRTKDAELVGPHQPF